MNRSCKRLHILIENNAFLWRDFEFTRTFTLNSKDLKNILKHSRGFERYLLGFWRINCEVENLNFIFKHGFQNSPKLYWLDLSYCGISTLSFLSCTPNLKILHLAHCYSLHDDEARYIRSCDKLNDLDISCTNMTADTVVHHIASNKKIGLTSLNVKGLIMTVEDFDCILQRFVKTLKFLHASDPVEEEEQLLLQNILQQYETVSFQ